MTKPKPRLLVALGGLLLAGLVLAGIKLRHHTMDMAWAIMAPPQEIGLATKMAELRRGHHFDEAIDLGLHSITGHGGDDSSIK